MQIQESQGWGWGDEANNINGRGQEITEQQGLTRRKNCSHEFRLSAAVLPDFIV